MGLIDRNDDGHVSVGEASFANLMYDEFEKANRNRNPDPIPGCGTWLWGCAMVIALIVGCFIGFMLIHWLIDLF